MTLPDTRQSLYDSLQDTLDLLHDYTQEHPVPEEQLAPLPSLLAQCEELCAEAPDPAPVRAIHHLACTGGTLISKCLSTMPNVTLLSEIDPLSRAALKPTDPRQFRPTDLIYGARVALRPIDDDTAVAMFLAALDVLHKNTARTGQYLVLRDHAHSNFCTDTAPAHRPTLHEILTRQGPVRAVVTVRHPLDSYLSLLKNNWRHFTPFTLAGYCARYEAFLDQHRDLPLFRYEDFVADPDKALEGICAALDLPFTEGAQSLLSAVSLSGNSGRTSTRISERTRREVPSSLAVEMEQSAGYKNLCARLGYAAQGPEVISGKSA